MTAPCAIEYILVTRWRWGKKGGQNNSPRSLDLDDRQGLIASSAIQQKKKWADLGLRPVVGTTVDIKISPQPLEHQELDLLLSCWRRWDHGSVPGRAINTWLVDVDCASGPDCEDSPHFKRVNIDCIEAIRLLDESGFGFLPESDLRNQPILETVMSVGLRQCALEFSAKQLNILSYLTMSGLLPETFPHERWVLAVQRSFLILRRQLSVHLGVGRGPANSRVGANCHCFG